MSSPSVLFFDDQFLMEGSPVLSTPTTFSSTSSDTSTCFSDISATATTLAGDVHEPEKPLHSSERYQHAEQLYLTAQRNNCTHSPPTANSRSITSGSLLDDALLHVLPHTPAHPRSCLDTPSGTTSIRHVSAHPRHQNCVQETEAQWPYGIDPSRLNKDLPALPKERKRVWRTIRRTVSHLFQRHHPKETPRPVSYSQEIPLRHTLQPSNSAPLKPSSASLISPRPRISCSSSHALLIPTVTTQNVIVEQSPAYFCKQQLRRSRSFSGYPNVLAAIADERPPLIDKLRKECNTDPFALDDDSSMDEVAAEVFEILREVHKTWKFAPLNEDDPAFQDQDLLFERGVERR